MKRLHCVYFDQGDSRWRRMARVLEYSAQKHNPDWAVSVERLATPSLVRGMRSSFAANTDKLHEWGRIITTATDGDEVCLIDADTLVRDSLDDAFALPFDVAFTKKDGTNRNPINGGVVFVRVNERSKEFFFGWLAVNDRFYQNPTEHRKWEARYGGINQAALGYLLENGMLPGSPTIAFLPCQQWNNCYPPLWQTPIGARVFHYKSALRRALFIGRSHGYLGALVALWKRYEAEAITQEGVSKAAVC